MRIMLRLHGTGVHVVGKPTWRQKGYLLFILDNRGSDNRGKEFEQATFRHLGQKR